MAEKLSTRQKCSNFCTFVYNSEEGTILGRNAKSWGEITFFYIIYYICLAGFFAACFAVFNTVLDDVYPHLAGEDSLLKANPGMGFKPMPDITTTLIRYDRMLPKSYKPYVDHINTYLEKWNKIQDGIDSVDCSSITTARPGDSVPCRANLNETINKCGDQLGYTEGKPCILLKLNKLFDWLPEPYDLDNLPGNMPQNLKNIYDQTKVWVSCEGENPGDTDNLGVIEFYPTQGFELPFFPYMNQKGYVQPLLFAKLQNIQPNVGILIECKAWAKNIWHDRVDRQGSFHFEIIID